MAFFITRSSIELMQLVSYIPGPCTLCVLPPRPALGLMTYSMQYTHGCNARLLCEYVVYMYLIDLINPIVLVMQCKAMGGDPTTISGLSGIGDLMLTCFGDLSRNRTCGLRLAKVRPHHLTSPYSHHITPCALLTPH